MLKILNKGRQEKGKGKGKATCATVRHAIIIVSVWDPGFKGENPWASKTLLT
jgi:hypothetical protein